MQQPAQLRAPIMRDLSNPFFPCLSFLDRLTGRLVSLDLVADGKFQSPAQLYAHTMRPLELMQAAARFFARRKDQQVIAVPYNYYSFCEAKLSLCKFILLLSFSQRTSLHESALRRQLEVARLLVETKAAVAARDRCFSAPPL